MPATITDRLFGLTTSIAVKGPCRTVATSNITLAGLQTINGVALVENDRVLVVTQTTASENGIYLASSSNWSRAPDFDGARDAVQGTQIPITTNGAQTALYEVSTANPFTIGTSDLHFTLRYSANLQYDITVAEIAAGVAPVNGVYPDGYAFRYGALGDDSTNNATALQNAINVMSAAGGGFVTVGDGTFRFGSTLTLKAGVSLRGNGIRATVLKYTGSGIAILTEDVFGSGLNNSSLEQFKLTTSTNAPSVGPGTHGLKLLNASYVDLKSVDIRGFSTAGVLLQADVGKACVYHTIDASCHIHENAIGLLTAGANVAINNICLMGASIRANTNWNIFNDADVLGWNISGCALEAGGTGGSGGSCHFNGGQGISFTGNYYEQSGGAAGLPCIDLASARATYGISIVGNRFIGSGAGTAVQLGTSQFVRGITVSANEFSGFSIGISAIAVIQGIIGPNNFDSVTTPVSVPGSSCTGLTVFDATGVRTYAAPVSQFTWDAATSTWNSFPAFKVSTVPFGSVAYGSFGTDTATVNGTNYFAELHLTAAMTITGLGILAGSVGGGSDKYIVSLYSATGALLANSALAGTTFGATNSSQQADFTAQYVAAPGKYWVAVQANGATGRIRTVAANTFIHLRTKSVAGTFATLPALTVPTTFTADVGPIAYVY